MATIKYLLQSKSNNSPIYIRLSLGRGKDYKRKTGLFIDFNDWNIKKNLPKSNNPKNKNIITNLKKLVLFIEEKLSRDLMNGNEINGNWLMDQIDIFFGRINEEKISDLLTDAIQYIIENASTRKNSKGSIGLSNGRLKAWKVLKNIIIKYEKQLKKRIKLIDIDKDFANKFLLYMLNDNNYSKSYAAKKLSDIKVACREMQSLGVPINSQLNSIQAPEGRNEYIIYLNKEELDKIENTELRLESLINARKWLLLGCDIGQRGSDLLNITKDNFVIRNGLEVIEITQEKTGKNVTIPILSIARKIKDSVLPYKISLMRFNKYIKEICLKAGIDEKVKGKLYNGITKRREEGTYPKWKLISSHVCRRSFATNHYSVLPTPLIMQVTAHSSEKVFLNYIGKNSFDYAKQIAEFYESRKLNELK